MTLERRFQSWPPTRSFPSDLVAIEFGSWRAIRIILDSCALHTGRFTSSVAPFFSLLSSIKSRPIIVAARFHGILNLSAAEKNIFEQPNREKRYLNVHKDIPVRILARISGCSRSCSCITVNTTSVATVVR